jgi:uncharacterized protein (UPF0332 family)
MTRDQAALLRKARENITAARLLAEKRLYDVAVSRAYYAMFYLAEALLLGDGLAFSKHSAVTSAFGQQFAKTDRVPRQLHRYLIDAQDSRVAADYDVRSRLSSESAILHIAHAEQFLEVAERLIGPIPPDEEEQP